MEAIERWVVSGGCPPWSSLTVDTLRHALSVAKTNLDDALLLSKQSTSSFGWSSFSKLERVWGNFDSVYRLCHAAHFLGGEKFLAVKDFADVIYQEMSNVWSSSRLLASRVARLIAQPSLPAWQAKALKSSELGSFAYERKVARSRRLSRVSTLEKLEKACNFNIAKSIEQMPIWTADKSKLKGMPQWLVDAGRERAKSRHWAGWVFYGNYREYRTFMSRCDDREMRQAMYKARSKAGSEYVAGCDNAMYAKKILATRKKEAKEAGYDSYADYCLSNHMIGSADEVEQLLLDYAVSATPHALNERHDLDVWMRERFAVSRLEPWDYRYARASVEQEATAGCMDAAQSYFSPSKTIDRCVAKVASFLGVDHKRRRQHECEDLMVYEIFSPQGFSGFITIVPSARPIEQDLVAFEWSISSYSKTRPVDASSMVMLQMECTSGGLGNLGHSDVVTLFHELGHAFHAVLGAGRCLSETPSGIEADALEMHSQLIERLAWEPDVLREIGRYRGRKMPWKVANTISALRNFHAGSWTIAQVTDALCDIRLHHNFKPHGKIAPWEVMIAIKKEVGLDNPKSYNRQAHQLGAFIGSYVCGDYAYLWSEGLAHSVFEKAWLAKGRHVGHNNELRQIFFDEGSRCSTTAQIKKYLGKKPVAQWLATSRGFN